VQGNHQSFSAWQDDFFCVRLAAESQVIFSAQRERDKPRAKSLANTHAVIEAVNPGSVVRDKEGKPYTVRYDAVNSMLLNEFLKEHRKVQELEKQVEKLTAGLQKVSDRLKASEAAPQMVANKQ
jgi:hypothetical protein